MKKVISIILALIMSCCIYCPIPGFAVGDVIVDGGGGGGMGSGSSTDAWGSNGADGNAGESYNFV